MALEIKDTNYEELLKSDKPLVIDFYAEWCGPCKVIGPFIDELSKVYDNVLIGKVNVDDNPNITTVFGVRNLPTILFIKGGEIVDKQVGSLSKSQLEERIKKLL